MNKQEKDAKEVEVAGWLKSKGYDRRTWQAMAKVIVEYLSEQQVNSVVLDNVNQQRKLLLDFTIDLFQWEHDDIKDEEKIVDNYIDKKSNTGG